MEKRKENLRIGVLDSFRAIAIFLVLLFHYFSRWTIFYPYSDKYNFFTYGQMGVQFFFIISGFVILYTLENTNNFVVFWKKRMIRLFPSILIASLITYFVFDLFDTELLFPTSHSLKNVLASIVFIPPNLLSSIFNHKVELDYTSGSYWSLWPEIQFYFYVSTLYFLNKVKFTQIFFGLTFILVLSSSILDYSHNDNFFIRTTKVFFAFFNFIEALPYFCFGVIFYILYKNKIVQKKIPVYLKIYFLGLVLLQILENYSQPLKLGLVFIFLLLFMALIYYPKLIHFLENKILLKIGVSSYFLYLIHENIGVFMIHKWGGFLESHEFIFPLIVILFLTAISIFYTFTIDKKINNCLKKALLKRKNSNQ